MKTQVENLSREILQHIISKSQKIAATTNPHAVAQMMRDAAVSQWSEDDKKELNSTLARLVKRVRPGDGKSIDSFIFSETQEKITPLFDAVRLGLYDYANALLLAGADPDVPCVLLEPAHHTCSTTEYLRPLASQDPARSLLARMQTEQINYSPAPGIEKRIRFNDYFVKEETLDSPHTNLFLRSAITAFLNATQRHGHDQIAQTIAKRFQVKDDKVPGAHFDGQRYNPFGDQAIESQEDWENAQNKYAKEMREIATVAEMTDRAFRLTTIRSVPAFERPGQAKLVNPSASNAKGYQVEFNGPFEPESIGLVNHLRQLSATKINALFGLELTQETVNQAVALASRQITELGLRYPADDTHFKLPEKYFKFQSSESNFVLQPQAIPSQAIEALFEEKNTESGLEIDCSVALQITLYKALLALVGSDKFNQKLKTMELNLTHYSQPLETLVSDVALTHRFPTFNELTDNISVGTLCYFVNTTRYLVRHPSGFLRGDNVIHVGVNEQGQLLFAGMFSDGQLKTEQQIIQQLVDGYNKEAPNTPSPTKSTTTPHPHRGATSTARNLSRA